MGRKQNAAQRTKGNLKPSSSARAAELLVASGNATTGGFLGFGLLKSTTQESDEVDNSFDSDFALVLKKTTKRDSVTKLKALQEFSHLCQEKETEAVSSVLQYWPKVFSKMTNDCDSRVREAANEVLEQLVLRVGRNLAPHLKYLMGTWLVAQCDVYAPAASAAKRAFNSAFSPEKQSEAMGFCKLEILAHIEDLLLKQNAVDPKAQAPDQEELARRQVQLVGSALEAWSLFTMTLPSKQLEQLHDGFAKILKDSKFWKFQKHSAGLVRAGFFHVIATLLETWPELAVEFADQICPSVLYSLDEKDPSVAHALWLTVLHTVSVVPEWWLKINTKKGLYPKLMLMLKNGGFGCAVISYPNLLPFLSLIPHETPDDKMWFYDRFFCEMKAGLALHCVQQSQSEMNAVVKAFVECIQFCIKRDLESSSPDQKFLSFLTLEQIVLLVEASFTDCSAALSRSRLYKDVVGLLAFIQKATGSNQQQPTKSEAIAEAILNDMMLKLSEKILQSLDVASGEPLARMALFLEECSPHLKHETVLERKQKKLVKFATEDPEVNTNKQMSQVASPVDLKLCSEESNSVDSRADSDDSKQESRSSSGSNINKLDNQKASEDRDDSVHSVQSSNKRSQLMKPNKVLSELSNKACLESLKRAKEASEPSHLAFFTRSFAAFASSDLVSFLVSNFLPSVGNSTADPTVTFIREILLPWMIELNQTSTSTSQRMIDFLIETAGVAWNILNEEIKTKQLSELIQKCCDCDLLCQLLQRFIASSNDAAVSQWLRDEEFGTYVVSVACDLCQQSSKISCDEDLRRNKRWGLLCLALSSDEYREPIINKRHLDCVLDVVHSALRSHLESNDDSVEWCIEFAVDVMYQFLMNIPGFMAFPCSLKLLLSIFQLSLQPLVLADAIREKVHATWQSALRTVVNETGFKLVEGGFLSQVIGCLREAVYGEAETVTRLKHFASVALRLRAVVLEASRDNPAVEDLLMEQLYCAYDVSNVTCWKNAVIVERDMLFCLSDLVEAAPISFDSVPKCVSPIAFTSLLMRETSKLSGKAEMPAYSPECKVEAGSETEQLASQDFDKVDTDEAAASSDAKVEPHFHMRDCDTLLDLAEGLAFCHAVTKNHFLTYSSSELCLVTSLLEENYAEITSHLPQGALDKIISESFYRSLKEGGLRCLGLQVLLQRLRELRMERDYFDMIGGFDRFLPLTQSHVATLQVAMPFFEVESIFQLAEFQLAQMMSCLDDDITEFAESMLHHLAVFNAAFSLQDCHGTEKTPFAELFLSVFSQIHFLREHHESLFLFDSPVSAENWTIVVFNIEVMRFFAFAVAKLMTVLESSQWDTILCSTVSWIQSIAETQYRLLDDVIVLAFTSAASELLQAISVCLQSVEGPEQLGYVPPNLLPEWKDLFSPTAYGLLVPLFFEVSEKLAKCDITPEVQTMLYSLCSAVVHCSRELLLEHRLSTRLVADEESNLPDSIQTLLNYCCPLLSSCHRCIQLAAYRLLFKVIPELSKYDDKTTAPEGACSDAECGRCPPRSLVTVIEVGDLGVRLALDDVVFGETAILCPFESGFSSAMAYLLGWNLLLEVFRTAASELRVQYAQWLSEHGIVNQYMQNIFHLMPQNPVIMLKDNLVSNSASKKLNCLRNMFSDDPSFEIRVLSGSQLTIQLQHIACCVYRRSLETLPALMRQWWMEQDKRVSGTVEKFTAKHVSPLLCARELQAIQETNGSFASMNVKARPATREVIATYTVEESVMELVITLPANMPFGAISVESGNRVGVTKPQWRNWMLQLTVFLGFQNGSILDALSLWKRNIDKRFEGVDDCMICFSVIHGSNYQLPKLQCRTCKKRFHSTCLYKWFKTSNNATCPLCRNLF